MTYFVLAAGYLELSLRDEQMGSVRIDELGLTTTLVGELSCWNERYQTIIPRDVAERSSPSASALIESLDIEGLKLADRIAAALEGEVKVRYYSEGLLKYLS